MSLETHKMRGVLVSDVHPRLLGRHAPSSKTAATPSTGDTVSSRECDGLGPLVGHVNHIALIVRDVGNSLQFYTQVLSFRQVGRPNFDRHGAWLSMGNLELHLIKGIPDVCRGKHPDDLIVSHIALEIHDASAVLARLKELQGKFKDLAWRQNVSVPTMQSSFEHRFESHTSAQGKLQQFFLEDPDGYWIELCNCQEDEALSPKEVHFSFSLLAKMVWCTLRWKKQARHHLQNVQQELAALVPIHPQAVSPKKLEFLMLRRNTYGDVCQDFSRDELLRALAKAGNHVPGAILILKTWRKSSHKVYKPPPFLDASGNRGGNFGQKKKMQPHTRPILAASTGSSSKVSARAVGCERNEVVRFLCQIGLEQHGQLLIRNGFDDLETLKMLEEDHMKDIGMPLGHILKLKNKLKDMSLNEAEASDSKDRFREDCGTAAAAQSAPALRVKNAEVICLPPPPSPAAMQGSLSHEMIDSVKRSWLIVKNLGMENVAKLLYKKLFQVAPETKKLFPLSVRMRYRDWASPKEEDPEDPDNSPALQKLFCKVLEAVGTAVAGLLDMNALVPHLTALGMRHINYNMKAEYFEYGGQAVILTLKAGLGELFTPNVELAWSMVYDFVSATIISGLHMAQQRQAEIKAALVEMSASHERQVSPAAHSLSSVQKALQPEEESSPPVAFGPKVLQSEEESRRQSSPTRDIPKEISQSCQKQMSLQKSFSLKGKDGSKYKYTEDWHWQKTGTGTGKEQERHPRSEERSELPTLLTAFSAEIRSRVCP